MKRERDERLTLAWDSAALTATAMAGKLKPLDHYLERLKPRRRGDVPAMIAVLEEAAARSGGAMTITRVREGT